jgi:predicted phosphodiesterase
MTELAFTRKTTAPNQRVLIFTDVHYGAQSERACEELSILVEEFKPTHIINLGDLFDNKEAGRWVEQTLHIVTMETGKPLPETYAEGVEWHDTILDKAPKGCKFTLVLGNHDDWTRQRLEKMKHLTGDFNPLINALQNSRHKVEVHANYPNNDFVLFTDPLVICSHGGAGTSGNHAKATWTKDYQLGASRIYGHAHDPQHWIGAYSVNAMARDDRFSIALGAMCDRSHKYFEYANIRARMQWRPTALCIEVADGRMNVWQEDFTPDELSYQKPQLLGQSLNF